MIILPANTLAAGGYDVTNSCRFNGDAYMHKTYGSAGNVDRWTFSAWFKIASSSGNICLFAAAADSNNYGSIVIKTDGSIEWQHYASASAIGILHTNRKLRDYSAWYNLICVYDSANGTAGDRMKMYINGTEETSFNTDTNPSSGQDSPFNKDDKHVIGAQDYAGGSFQNYWKGYLAEVVFLDGTAASATDLGEFDDDSPTIWKPIDVSGLTFGSNGFYLDFEDSGDLDDDESGESNDYTAVSLAATDQSTDTPTLNYPTLNPLVLGSYATLSEGNLHLNGNTSSDSGATIATVGFPENGKWYIEEKMTDQTGQFPESGVFNDIETDSFQSNLNAAGGIPSNSAGVSINCSGNIMVDGSSAHSISAITDGQIKQYAIDMDNGAIYIGLNNTWYNSGDPTSGSSRTGAIDTWTAGTRSNMMFGATAYNGSDGEVNFGSPAYANSSDAADANGYGAFEYAPPTGYYALNSKNIAEFG
jgi:hypothetical protein